MFRPVPMMRLSAVVLERDKRAVLQRLGELGAMELACLESGPDTAPLPARDFSGELLRCNRDLERVEQLRSKLGITTLEEVHPVAPMEVRTEEQEAKLQALEERTNQLLNHRDHLLKRSTELDAVQQQVASYCGLEIPLGEADQFSFLHFVTGSLPPEKLEDLQRQSSVKMALLPLPENNGRLPLIAMTTRQGWQALEAVLKDAGFQREILPAIERSTPELLTEKSREEQADISGQLQRLNREIGNLAVEAAQPLADLKSSLNYGRILLETEQNFPRTESTFLLTGWVPAADVSVMEGQLREITRGHCVIETARPEDLSGAQVPVLLRHSRLLRPFEMLVAAYGLPEYQEIEPTLFLAVSYLLMFGMMFGDVGHGATLLVFGMGALWAGRSSAKRRDIGLLLIFGGLSSLAFGILYGSYFGLIQLKKYAIWHDPIEGNPIRLMQIAIGAGVGIISLGLILNIVNRFRFGDVIGGLLDKFGVAGVLFYWGGIALFTKQAALRSHGLLSSAVILFLVVPATAWVLKEPLRHALDQCRGKRTEPEGWFIAIAESLVGAFEGFLVYLANTISFVRLAAYAMSHSALLMAIFLMAEEVRRYSEVGNVLSLLIIIFGNLIVIALEGLVGAVQALRLEYYEFFGKFFSGGGQPFRPFCLPQGK